MSNPIKLQKSSYPYAVVTTYSWEETEGNVVLCKDHDTATTHLRENFLAESRSDEESGHKFEASINEDGTYAKIINYRRSGDIDTTEWRVLCGGIYVAKA